MALQDILGSMGQGGQGQPPQEAQGQAGQPSGLGGLGGNNPLAVAGAMGGGGIKKLAQSIIAIAAEVLKWVMVTFSVDSKEYNDLSRIVKSLQGLSGDAKPTDIQSAIQSLLSALPPSTHGKSPLEGLLGGSSGAGATPPAPPTGAPTGMPGASPGAPQSMSQMLGG